MSSEPTSSPAVHAPPAATESPVKRMMSVVWALVVALAGGAVCGWCIDRLATLGALSLWPLGVVAGYIAARLNISGRFAAWTQVAACLLAFLVAETYWIRSNEADGWWPAVCYWPTFISDYEVPALVGVACAAFGAEAAFRQTRRARRSAA